MGGGKGDISITGSGTSPIDEYSQMSSVLPDDFPTFDDGAGEVELMEFGNWVNDGGPPWYYPFSVIVISDYDYFGFALTAFFTNEVGSIGALAADGDFFLDASTDRVYIYGVSGTAPTVDTYVHACQDQLIVEGAGPLDMPEQEYTAAGGLGIKRVGGLTGDAYIRTDFGAVHHLLIGDRGFGYADGHQSNPQPHQIGGWYSTNGGVTWTRSTQSIHGQSFDWDQPFPNPPITQPIGERDIMFGSSRPPANIGNSTSYLWPAGNKIGFMPMSADGQLMIYLPETASSCSFFWTANGGVNWNKGPNIQVDTGYQQEYGLQLATPANRFESQAWCRDARVIVDPSPTTGWGWVFYGMDRRSPPNNCIIRLDLAANKTEVPPLFLAFWGTPVTQGIADEAQTGTIAASVQATGNLWNSRGFHLSSTYDATTGKMWLHAMGRNSGNQDIYYGRSDNEGVSWSIVHFTSAHDPDYVASGGTAMQQGMRAQGSIETLVSPDCQTLWMVAQYGSPNGPFFEKSSQHLYRSVDHGATWDKITKGPSANPWPYSGGFTKGAGGFLNAQGIGEVQLHFLNNDIPQTKMLVSLNKWFYNDYYYWEFNQTGTHGGLIDSMQIVQDQTREYINFFHPSGKVWGDGLASTPCGFEKGGPQQVLDQWHIGTGNRYDRDPAWPIGAGCQDAGNYRKRGGYHILTVAPTDATFFNICDEAGFIIRAEHVNGLVKKLQELQAFVIARGTFATDFGLELGDQSHVVAGDDSTEGDPVRADDYDKLRREFEIRVKPQVPNVPGGPFYSDGVDFTDIEYDILPPVANDQIVGTEPPNPIATVSIRTLISMRKIIQALYTNGWFCSCHQYCPCQTDITVTGSKK